MQQNWLRLHAKDNLVVALSDLPAGHLIEDTKGTSLRLSEAIRAKHKFTDRAVSSGEALFMYGVVVGKALTDIPAGGLIHTGNVVHDE